MLLTLSFVWSIYSVHFLYERNRVVHKRGGQAPLKVCALAVQQQITYFISCGNSCYGGMFFFCMEFACPAHLYMGFLWKHQSPGSGCLFLYGV